MTQISTSTAGIDTSKAKLDIAVHGRAERWQVDNTSRGEGATRSALRPRDPQLPTSA
jgi:transposase